MNSKQQTTNFDDIRRLFDYINSISTPGQLIDDPIEIKIAGTDDCVLQFKTKVFTPLKRILDRYCKITDLEKHALRFRFDGNPVTDDDTPASLDMADGDTIEVYYQQIGGGNDDNEIRNQPANMI